MVYLLKRGTQVPDGDISLGEHRPGPGTTITVAIPFRLRLGICDIRRISHKAYVVCQHNTSPAVNLHRSQPSLSSHQHCGSASQRLFGGGGDGEGADRIGGGAEDDSRLT